MKPKTSNGTNGSNGGLKTWAVKLKPETHERVAEKCRAAGIGMQQLGEQCAELFLTDSIRLKRNLWVDDEVATALANISDPKIRAAVLKAAKGA